MFPFFTRKRPAVLIASTFFYFIDSARNILTYDGKERRYAACPQVGPGNYVEIVLGEIPHPKNRAAMIEVVYGKELNQ